MTLTESSTPPTGEFMFRRILIANRGEVVARVMRTAQAMDIEVVVPVTDADRGLAFLDQADRVEPIGGTRAYLDRDALIAVAKSHACSAVHPGWGFLSENPTFAAQCEAAGITFIGPDGATMRMMADKAAAKSAMDRMGVPTIPGSDGPLADGAEARAVAEAIGYPVLLKAVSGGGGRGMRVVRTRAEVEAAFEAASAEAHGAFGDGRLYMEKLIENGRHIEFQVMGDGVRVQVLGERECSIQRRHQKLLEETPSPGLATVGGRREEISAVVARACEALGYRGAGTVEMLMDSHGSLYFMEMNTRLQVEHTITEEVTGEDLVQRQLQVAANHVLEDLGSPQGCSIQCRINAEDVSADFQPRPGKIERLTLPTGEGIRVDTHLVEGDKISPHYDSMIAKIIATGSDRTTAIARMKQALQDFEVVGVPTTAGLHLRLLDHPEFVAGQTDTGLLERILKELV